MPTETKEIIDYAVNQAGKDRRIANQAQELRLMKWMVGIAIMSVGAIGAGAVALYRIDTTAAVVNAMPAPEAHREVHKTGDQRVSYIEKEIIEVKKNQEKYEGQFTRIETNSYKAATQTAIIIEKLEQMAR
tara:strand:- start:94 stop:486 length:393 start_codon:yes stop_codon:yes gene_type:complete